MPLKIAPKKKLITVDVRNPKQPNGIKYLLTGAGFLPSTAAFQQWIFRCFCC